MKINKILVALCFFVIIVSQIASARNIIARVVSGNANERLSVSNHSMLASALPKRRAPIRAVMLSMV